MKSDNLGVDVETMAKLINVTPRFVQELANEPGFPAKLGPGRYDASATTIWYMRRLQAELYRRGDVPEPAELRAARLRLLRAQADRVNLYNDIQSGKLLHKVDVSNALTRRLINCRDRLRGIGAGLGPQLTNKSREYIEERLRVAVEQALTELDGPDWSTLQ
jgi:phage terminase Nu1 subunit (DNA packaging protein)